MVKRLTIFVMCLLMVSAVSMGAEKATRSALEKETSSSLVSTGIEVHGHWQIEVRNMDGSVDSFMEFENELIDASVFVYALTLYPSEYGSYGG